MAPRCGRDVVGESRHFLPRPVARGRQDALAGRHGEGIMRKDLIENAIMGLQMSSRDIQGCAVVSSDGQMVACSLKPGTDPDRVGAMSAAVQKLGKEAARELGCGALEQIMLKGDSG